MTSLERTTATVERIQKTMRITKGARFEAARRHKFAGRASSYAVVILSVWIFAISVLTLVYASNIKPTTMGYFSSINLILSFFVIAFTLLQGSKQHEIRAELFLRCAHDIQSHSSRLEMAWDQALENYCQQSVNSQQTANQSLLDFFKNDLSKIEQEYQRTLSSFEDNHSDIDFNIYRFKSFMNVRKIVNNRERQYARVERALWLFQRFWYVQNPVVIALAIPALALAGRKFIETTVLELPSLATIIP